MAPRLWKDRHRVAVYEEPQPGRYYAPGTVHRAVADPETYIAELYWHSNLTYFETVYDRTVTLTLPARGAPPGTQKWPLPAHGLGFIPHGVLRIGDTQIPTGQPIQGTSAATRHVFLGIDASNVWIREAWNYNSLPAITRTFRVILFRQALSNVSAHLLEESPERIVYGGGKFSTDRSYIKHATASPDFWMTRGRTIDTKLGGYKGVTPNGAATIIGAYTGSFAGSGFFGVDD